jgi:hypothetical protein
VLAPPPARGRQGQPGCGGSAAAGRCAYSCWLTALLLLGLLLLGPGLGLLLVWLLVLRLL